MFQTLDGLQVPTLTVEQIREADRVAVGETGPALADIGIGDAIYKKIGIRMQSPFAGAPYIRLHVRRKASPVIPGMPL